MSWMVTQLLLITLSLSFAESFDYCTTRCHGRQHTMCAFQAGGGVNCTSYRSGLTEEETHLIVDLHNELRQRVALGNQEGQPPASNMMEMTWDDEAAMIAQRWADQCGKTGEVDQCRTNSRGEPGVPTIDGRTTIMPVNRNLEIKRMVLSWYNRGKHIHPNNVDRIFSAVSPNSTAKERRNLIFYAGTVWASSSRIGCGFSARESGTLNKYKLVCNYYPGKDYLFYKPIYKRGKACSQCPVGSKCSSKWYGLCSETKNDGKQPYFTPTVAIIDGKMNANKSFSSSDGRSLVPNEMSQIPRSTSSSAATEDKGLQTDLALVFNQQLELQTVEASDILGIMERQNIDSLALVQVQDKETQTNLSSFPQRFGRSDDSGYDSLYVKGQWVNLTVMVCVGIMVLITVAVVALLVIWASFGRQRFVSVELSESSRTVLN